MIDLPDEIRCVKCGRVLQLSEMGELPVECPGCGAVGPTDPDRHSTSIRDLLYDVLGLVMLAGPGERRARQREVHRRLMAAREEAARAGLVGRQGRAVTALRPGGVVMIDEQRYDATAVDGYHDAGASVMVVEVRRHTLAVKGAG